MFQKSSQQSLFDLPSIGQIVCHWIERGKVSALLPYPSLPSSVQNSKVVPTRRILQRPDNGERGGIEEDGRREVQRRGNLYLSFWRFRLFSLRDKKNSPFASEKPCISSQLNEAKASQISIIGTINMYYILVKKVMRLTLNFPHTEICQLLPW